MRPGASALLRLVLSVGLWVTQTAALANPPGLLLDLRPLAVIPGDNPQTPAKIALGRALFSEPLLSRTRTFSCASCHNPDNHFIDGRQTAMGATGEKHTRNTPTLYNVAYNASFGWDDAGIALLEDQHLIPLTNTSPVEMGFDAAHLPELQNKYGADFQTVFGAPDVSLSLVIKAIASYVRTIVPPESPYDRYVYWDEPLTPLARAGFALFTSDRLACGHCHASFNLSGPIVHEHQAAEPVFHHTAVGGSHEHFRAPTLRAIRFTAPYMHNGSLPDLDSVIDHYEATDAERIPEFKLSPEERSALIAFLNSL